MITWPAKLPAAEEKYAFEWAEALGTDTIDSVVALTADGATIESSQIDGTQVQLVISGGTLGTVAKITNTILTSGGETYSELALLPIGEEPVSLAEAKAQCRMTDDDSEDEFICSLIHPARAYVEKVSTFSLMAGTREFTFGAWGNFLELFIRPVTSVETVAYVDEAGNDAEYEGFLAPLGRYPLRVYPGVNDSFPALASGGAITVTLAVGALDPARPEWLIAKRAILLLIGHWFEFREAAMAGVVSPEIAFAVNDVLDTIRPVSAY